MPRREAAATSIVLYPAPARTTSLSAPAASTSSGTLVERTTSDHIDRVVPRAGAHYQFERAGGQHVLRYFGGTHHQRIGAELLHLGGQRLLLEFRREAHFASQPSEFVPPGLFE